MTWDHVDLMLILSGIGGTIITVFTIFLFMKYLFFDEPDVNIHKERIIIKLKNEEKCHVYIEKDGIITCIYNPERETH